MTDTKKPKRQVLYQIKESVEVLKATFAAAQKPVEKTHGYPGDIVRLLQDEITAKLKLGWTWADITDLFHSANYKFSTATIKAHYDDREAAKLKRNENRGEKLRAAATAKADKGGTKPTTTTTTSGDSKQNNMVTNRDA